MVKMLSVKTTSKTSLLKSMLIKAWRERWTEFQWGINIKTVLPRGVSGDVYNLADCILQQAIGVGVNQLLLSYLKHSLCSHLISHSAVLKRISKYNSYDRYYCLNTILEFLNSIIDGVTCRSKPEEGNIVNAILELVNWVAELYLAILEKVFQSSGNITQEQQECIRKILILLEKIVGSNYLTGILYVSKFEDPALFAKLDKNFKSIKTISADPQMTRLTATNTNIVEAFNKILQLKIEQLEMVEFEPDGVENVTYCLQPWLAVEVLLNPSTETSAYISELQMIQRLKGYSNARLYCELIRACLICLMSVSETNKDSMWCAFTFIKVPHMLKQMNAQANSSNNTQLDYSEDVVKAFEMLLEHSMILDPIDIKCGCNTIECLLIEMKKQNLINEKHVQFFTKKREVSSQHLQRVEVNTSIINYVMRAEAPLAGILRTLCTDYNKMQEPLLSMLCQVLSGNSFELILAVSSVQGKLKTFVSRLISCNEHSLQIAGEVGKPAMIRMALFDISFLMLCFIVQTYGSEVVLEENGNTFFERWVRDCMVERGKEKPPLNIVRNCDQQKVDELLMYFHSPDSAKKPHSLKWHEVCSAIPAVLYHVLIAWENKTLFTNDVIKIMGQMRTKLYAYSVCAASWLCSYLQIVRHEELRNPLLMLQQLSQLSQEEMQQNQKQETHKERQGLMLTIIRKMQHDFHPAGSPKIRALMQSQNLVSQKPMADLFNEHWKIIQDRGWLPIESAQTLESLLKSCGPFWLVNKFVEKILQCKFIKDMQKTMDVSFAIMHLNIESCTIALLNELLPVVLINSSQKNPKLVEPYSRILAKLCVYSILSAIETPNATTKKRSRTTDDDDMSQSYSPNTKARKIVEQGGVGSGLGTESESNETQVNMKESLQQCLQTLFRSFQNEIATDELSTKIYFIFQFFSLLVQCGKTDRIKLILKLIPTGLIQNLLKIIPIEELSVGFILRLYDLGIPFGRQSAVSDLCLLRNIQIRRNSIKL